MQNLSKFRLLNLLCTASEHVKDNEIESAYEELLEQTYQLMKVEEDVISAIRKLNVIYIEFSTLDAYCLCGEEQKYRNVFSKKIILFLESELKILYSLIQMPNSKQFEYKTSQMPNATWKITDNDIIELGRALYAANIAFVNGKPKNFIQIIRKLEYLFGVKVKRPHNKVTRISERVDVSPFLNLLLDSYISDLESRL